MDSRDEYAALDDPEAERRAEENAIAMQYILENPEWLDHGDRLLMFLRSFTTDNEHRSALVYVMGLPPETRVALRAVIMEAGDEHYTEENLRETAADYLERRP